LTDRRDAGVRLPAPAPAAPPEPALGYAEAERHPLVEAFVAARCRDRGRPRLDVAAGDEMLHYALAEQFQHRGLALFAYLRSGLTAAETLEQVLAWRFGEPGRTPSLLDFAAGWGRVTRFLAQPVGAGRITAGAVDFQRRLLGVETVLSTPRAEDLRLDRRFAAVAACSLFTHLPDSSFRRWLARLWRAVDDGGLLIFSVNDEAVLFSGRAMPERGLYFEPVSENVELGSEDYGTTWVAERFVARALDEACGGAVPYVRIPRGLWHFQDLYVVPRPPVPTSLAPLAVELPPEGYLDACIPVAPGRLRVSGWAIDRGAPATPPLITVEIDGEVRAETRASEERPDLAVVHGAAHLRSGFLAEASSGAGAFRPDQTLAIRATSLGGRDTLLHLSPVEGADLGRRVAGALDEVRGENLHLRRANADLHRKVAMMEQSRFWKLRDLWWRVRGRR
jgi:hypothetical protein